MFKSIRTGKVDRGALVVGVFSGALRLPSTLSRLPAADREDLNAALKSGAHGFKADVGECWTTSRGHILLGLGKQPDLKPESLRTAGARLAKRLDRVGITRVRLAIGETVASRAIPAHRAGRCLGEGMGFANWRVDFFTGKATRQTPARASLTMGATDRDFLEGLREGLDMADHVNYARRIAATPPNICNPPWLANEARHMARQVGLKCRVISHEQAARMGMGGIANVGMGSRAKPCLIILEHSPRTVARAARGQTIALVGKSITYDTGGYSLKINNGMKGMKYDKCGGMAVLGAMRAVASMKLPVRVVGLLPAAENMVSDDSYRPDDIITHYNGVTCEVTNTDAEGRLVLADALAYACKDIKATAIVDLATLTGGIVTALGHFCSGLFCNDDRLLERVERAAESAGERVWRMPLWNDHKDFMRSQHADLLNSNPSRNAHPIQGAAFLAYFVDDNVPWAHLDIAGVANVEKDTDLFVSGPTGYGVRLLVEMLEQWAG